MQLEKREPVWMKKGHSSAGCGGTKKPSSRVMAGHPTPRQTKMGTNCACHPRSGVRRARLYHHLHISCGHSSLNNTGEATSNYSELEDLSQGIPVGVRNKLTHIQSQSVTETYFSPGFSQISHWTDISVGKEVSFLPPLHEAATLPAASSVQHMPHQRKCRSRLQQ